MGAKKEWVRRYVNTMGSALEVEEEATDAQLAPLYKSTVMLKQALYCDCSVWTPFGRRALRSQKFHTYVPLWGWLTPCEGIAWPPESSTVDCIMARVQGGGHFTWHSISRGLAAVRANGGAPHIALAPSLGPHSPC